MSFFEELVQGLNEAIEYKKGTLKAKETTITVTESKYTAEEAKEIRLSLNMSQSAFAKLMNVSLKTVEAWERPGRIVKGTAARMLDIAQGGENMLSICGFLAIETNNTDDWYSRLFSENAVHLLNDIFGERESFGSTMIRNTEPGSDSYIGPYQLTTAN